MKIKKKLKIDYRHWICIGILAFFVFLGIVYFPNAICRLCESVRDFALSFAYYFTELYEAEGLIVPTINTLPSWQIAESKFQPLTLIPQDFDVFWEKFLIYFQKVFDWDMFLEYLFFLAELILNLSRLMLPIITLIYAVVILFQSMFRRQNNKYNVDSASVQLVRWIYKYALLPVCRYLRDLWRFARSKRYVFIASLMWAFYFNFFTILVEAFAYYLYFCVSFDFLHLYIQVYKLLLDLTPIIRFLPLPVWIVLIVNVWHRLSCSVGMDRLHHHENKNRGFGNARQLFIYIVGLMGAGKTTQGVDMARTYAVQMRDDAFEVILENDLRFPMFPWINLELVLKDAFEKGIIYNIPTCKRFIRFLQRRFEEENTRENIFDYDYNTYAMTYFNHLSVMSIWDSILEYSQAYFIYTIQTSLLITTFSMRDDMIMNDIGNFPLWNHDFFSRDARLMDSYSVHSHIFDQDMVRLGKQMIKNNPNRFAFGFGVYFWDELDKERKNTPELQDLKKGDDKINQKNDLMEPMIKVIRHGCMIGRRNFVRCIGTGQRADDLGAKLRGVCEVINVADVSDTDLTLPLWAPYYIFTDFFGRITRRFAPKYYQYRFNRSDNVLPVQGWHYLVAKIVQFQEIMTNRFGYKVVELEVEQGKINTKFKKVKYYRQFDKVYKEVFVSDALGGWFERRGEMSEVGLMDIPCYCDKRATAEEMDKCNLLFIHEFNSYLSA